MGWCQRVEQLQRDIATLLLSSRSWRQQSPRHPILAKYCQGWIVCCLHCSLIHTFIFFFFFFFYTAGSSFQPDPKEERRIFFWPHISHLPDYINVLPCLYWWPAALLTSIYWSVRLANETANTTQTNTPTTRILLNNTYECARRLARLHMDTQLLFTSSTCQIAQQLAVCLRMNLNNFVKF